MRESWQYLWAHLQVALLGHPTPLPKQEKGWGGAHGPGAGAFLKVQEPCWEQGLVKERGGEQGDGLGWGDQEEGTGRVWGC